MTHSDPAKPVQHTLASDVFSAVRYNAGSRTVLIAIATAGFGLGAWFNWGWLAAAGIAPLIIGVLPCAAMCALGLCMSGRTKSPTDMAPHVHGDTPETPSTGAELSQLGTRANAKEKGDCCGS